MVLPPFCIFVNKKELLIMSFLELSRKRFSARSYRKDEVEQEKLDYILECARIAPSAVNFQPWRFIVVKSEDQKKKLQECYAKDWFKTAPLYIVVCADPSEAWKRRADGKCHADVDAAIAAEHICLAAADVGLGSCWVCNFKPDIFGANFKLPEGQYPVAIIPIGYIDEMPQQFTSRKDAEDIISVI